MIRNLFIQIWNNKRSNGWLLVELLLVFCFIWYIVDFFFVLGFNYSLKNYRDLNYAWKINISTYPPGHPSYDPDRNMPENKLQDFNRLLDRLQRSPLIESVGVSYNEYSIPASGSSSYSSLIDPADSTRLASASLLHFCPKSDFLSVFRYTKEEGHFLLDEEEYDWSVPGGIFISRLVEKSLYPQGTSAKGKILAFFYEPTEFRVLDVVDDVKQVASGRPEGVAFIAEPLNRTNLEEANISIRATSTFSDNRFKTEFFHNVARQLQIGNYYFRNMTSYNQIEARTEKMHGLTNDITIRLYMMAFFLINIILCLIGTFWYRVSRRNEEIGIRMAMGSTRSGIKQLFVTEALGLLLLVFPLAIILEYQIVNLDLLTTYGDGIQSSHYIVYRPLLRFLYTNLITFFVIGLTVSAAVWLPAQKAAGMHPADALHDE